MSFQLLYFIVYWIQHSLPFHPLRLSDFSMLSPLTLFDQPCLCLCLGFSQMILMLPFLLITLHFSQMGFTDDLTFMVNPPFTFVSAFLGAGIDILIPARKSTDKIIIRGNANCKQNFQKQFRHQKNEKADCAGLPAAGRFLDFCWRLESSAIRPQPAGAAGCSLLTQLPAAASGASAPFKKNKTVCGK